MKTMLTTVNKFALVTITIVVLAITFDVLVTVWYQKSAERRGLNIIEMTIDQTTRLDRMERNQLEMYKRLGYGVLQGLDTPDDPSPYVPPAPASKQSLPR